MSSQNVTRLNTLVEKFEELKSEFNEYKEKTGRKIKVLLASNAEMKERLSYLEALVELEEGPEAMRGGNELYDAEEARDAGDPGEDNGVIAEGPEYKQKIIASELAKKSKPIKDVVNKTFKLLMGLERLEAKSLPSYPHGIDSTNWPKDISTGKELLRFDWKKSYRESPNQEGLRTGGYGVILGA